MNYSAPASQPAFRTVPGRAAASHAQAQSWSQQSQQPWRPGHAFSASVGNLYAAPPPVISAPLSQDGSLLGLGAQVVRTPQDALDIANFRDRRGRPSPGHSPPPHDHVDLSSPDDYTPPTPPAKPRAAPPAPSSRPQVPPRSRSPLRTPPLRSSPRDSLGVPISDLVSPPPPPFRPVLVSKVPTHPIDPSEVLVIIETSSSSLKTTFDTLTSRPSYMCSFLKRLVQTQNDGDGVSEEQSAYSDPNSPYHSLFQDHLAAVGFLPEVTHNIHIFLDRPSESYPHVLAYLRAPGRSYLPHAVRLSQKLEDLVALRDEARYLGLLDLAHMCSDEISRHRLVRPATSTPPLAPVDRKREKGSRSPDPIIPTVISPPDNLPVGAVARPGYI